MLKRKMYDKLLAWKSAPKKKVLILLGARQTGKTFIVREFARDNYPNFLEVNFLEDEDDAAFLAGADSADELVSRLSLIAGRALEPGTLVFLDEVQRAASNIVTLSKFLLDNGRFDLILSGSLLGAALEGVTSFPVGYARTERMYPLDFEEFCWATGVPVSIIDKVKTCYRDKKPLEHTLHERLTKLYRQYIAVGGMPEAVQRFLDGNRDLGAAREVATDIAEQYRFDITKYATGRKLQIRTIFDNIPSQLSKENKRFMMKSVKQGATYERLDDDFAWLVSAGVALPTVIASEPKYPLARTKVPEKFKLYSSDCGLLLAQYPQVAAIEVVSGEGDANFGAVYENVVAQEIKAAGFPLYYYHNSRKGEMDFLLETGEGTVIPLEVKSGKDYKHHVALNNLLETEEYGIECAYVLSEHNVSTEVREGKPVYYLPLYMTLCLSLERGNDLEGVKLEEVSFDDWT
ncbi:ATP-binding protein [Gordonibacter sp. KGMB07426]|uniref:ATP-binding protein n=1 Tax=Gordonibacter sp. KGMB07426 TaxID=3404046 RepID=UPI003B286249